MTIPVFAGNSAYGDESELTSSRARVPDAGIINGPKDPSWLLNVSVPPLVANVTIKTIPQRKICCAGFAATIVLFPIAVALTPIVRILVRAIISP